MKKLLLMLWMPMVCFGGPNQGGGPFPSGGSNPTGSGTNLTQVPVGSLVQPTTNSVYDATVAYSGVIGTIHDALGNTTNLSAYDNKQWFSSQTSPRVLTNSVLPPAYFFWATNDVTIGSAGWVFAPSLDVSANDWISSVLSPPPLGTNGSSVNTSGWEDGQGSQSTNTFQFKTNTSITYAAANVVLNRQTNLVVNIGTSGQVEFTNLVSEPAINIVSGLSNAFLRIATVPQATGNLDVDTFLEIKSIPSHGGPASLANGEIVLSSGQMALAHERHLQIGLAGNSAAYTYMQRAQGALNATTTVNNSQPLFFRIQGRVNAASETHYPGIYSTYVTTNAPHGTYYTALNFQQNAGFDAEDGSNWSISSTNEAFRAWGGNTNTFEFLVPVQFDRSIDARTNVATFQFSPITPTNWLSIATRTTNTAQRATLELDLGFVDAATGTPVAKIVVEHGTTITNTWTCSAPGTVVSTITNHFSFRLNPSSVVTITDISRGSGASVTVANSQLTSE